MMGVTPELQSWAGMRLLSIPPVLLLEQRRLCWAVLGGEKDVCGTQSFAGRDSTDRHRFGKLLPVNGSAVTAEMHPRQGQPGVQWHGGSCKFKQVNCAVVLLVCQRLDIAPSPGLGLQGTEKLRKEIHIFQERIFIREEKNCRQVGCFCETSPRQKPLHVLEGAPSEAGT